MNLFVYRQRASESANELVEALDGQIGLGNRVKRFRASQMPMEQKAASGDIVICWGETFGGKAGVRVLNGTARRNKYEDALELARQGVPTIGVSRTRPATQPAMVQGPDPAIPAGSQLRDLCEEFSNLDIATAVRTAPFRTGLNTLNAAVNTLIQTLNRPIPTTITPAQEWLARTYDHVGGDDLLSRPSEPDFYARKEAIAEEFRVHSFCGRSIRAGKKIPRGEGITTHPWIRSWDGGWRISYDGISSTKAIREIAHKAVGALGLDFGAVDIGVKTDGSLIVLEVNRAPGIKQGTIDCYVEAIKKWVRGEWRLESDSDPDRGDA